MSLRAHDGAPPCPVGLSSSRVRRAAGGDGHGGAAHCHRGSPHTGPLRGAGAAACRARSAIRPPLPARAPLRPPGGGGAGSLPAEEGGGGRWAVKQKAPGPGAQAAGAQGEETDGPLVFSIAPASPSSTSRPSPAPAPAVRARQRPAREAEGRFTAPPTRTGAPAWACCGAASRARASLAATGGRCCRPCSGWGPWAAAARTSPRVAPMATPRQIQVSPPSPVSPHLRGGQQRIFRGAGGGQKIRG